jgi:uncharacterized protein with HEPN domain
MSRRDDAVRLHDMLDAAQAAVRVLGDRSAEELEQTEVLALAVPHAVEIVGEAAGRVSRSFCEAHPEIPWSEVTGMRHRIVHDYFAVDYQRLWDTVRGDLPPLIAQLQRILAEADGAD